MLSGKGFYVWKLKDMERGDASAAAQLAKAAGLSHVLIKATDGPWAYNQRPYYQNGVLKYADDIFGPAVAAFKGQGLEVWGWGFVYLDDPKGEVTAAVKRVKDYGLDGWVINAESAAKNKPAAAKVYASFIKTITGVPIALSSFRFPSLHPEFPWAEFLTACDLNMPQVYWLKATNPGIQLVRTIQEFTALYSAKKLPFIPIFPTGAAFTEYGWTATAREVHEFLVTAEHLGLTGANFWEWNQARQLNLWETVASYPWFDADPDPEPDPQPEPPPVGVAEWVVKYAYPWMAVNGFSGPAPSL